MTEQGTVAAPLADLCDRDPLDLEADPRTCAVPRPAAQPCGPLCTPWCLASHTSALRTSCADRPIG